MGCVLPSCPIYDNNFLVDSLGNRLCQIWHCPFYRLVCYGKYRQLSERYSQMHAHLFPQIVPAGCIIHMNEKVYWSDYRVWQKSNVMVPIQIFPSVSLHLVRSTILLPVLPCRDYGICFGWKLLILKGKFLAEKYILVALISVSWIRFFPGPYPPLSIARTLSCCGSSP